MTSNNWTPKDFMALTRETWKACAIQAAVGIDLFTALDQPNLKQLSVEELSKKIGCDPRATGMLVTALVSLGLLDREGDEICLTDCSRRYLSARSGDYYGHMIKHSAHIMPAWINLEKAVRSGGKVAESPSPETADEAQREAFLMGMFNVARLQAEAVTAALDISDRQRLLDLGGGPGTYAAYFCHLNPGLRAVIFDLPTSEKVAQKVLASLGLLARVEFVGGDFNTDPLPGFFDVIWISQVLHQLSPQEVQALIDKAVKSLTPNGFLVIQEFLIGNERRGPVPSALFALNMLVNTQSGQSYTFKELADMLQKAGLTSIRRVSADLPPGCAIILAIKP
jgi:SAM-dependent methyltransferase